MWIPSPESIQAWYERAVTLVEWFAKELRSKNWTRKLVLIDVLVLSSLNPWVFPATLERCVGLTLPASYNLLFWMVVGLLFLAAVIVAVRSTPAQGGPLVSPAERSAIKGLRPFGFEDADLFTRLQREENLRECFQAITDHDFQFGILCGESGSGKTSLLQAGLWPRLAKQAVSHCCVYVKLSEVDPLEAIRQALADQLQLSRTAIEGADFLRLLESAVQHVKPKTVVLFLDQFEQFFVHRKRKKEREPFVQALATWYRSQPPLPVKV